MNHRISACADPVARRHRRGPRSCDRVHPAVRRVPPVPQSVLVESLLTSTAGSSTRSTRAPPTSISSPGSRRARRTCSRRRCRRSSACRTPSGHPRGHGAAVAGAPSGRGRAQCTCGWSTPPTSRWSPSRSTSPADRSARCWRPTRRRARCYETDLVLRVGPASSADVPRPRRRRDQRRHHDVGRVRRGGRGDGPTPAR